MKLIRVMLCLVMMMSLSSCSYLLKPFIAPPIDQLSAQQLFNGGKSSLASGDYSTAAKYFESLNAQYPFGKYSQQAMMDLIYAYYKKGDNPSAAAAAQRYIHLYPRAKNVDYAYYMKGVANFEQNRGLFADYLPMDLSQRDPGTMLESYQDFRTLLRRFPDSQYAADGRQRMIFLRNMFAKKELSIAQFYMHKKMYVAADNRANYLVQNYPQAPQVEPALVIMVKANRKLGIKKNAQQALSVLRLNYPNSKALRRLS